MKKMMCLLICLAVFLLALSGCTGGKPASTGGQVTTVRVWTSDAGGKTVWEQLVDQFNKTTGKEKGINIEWTTYASDFLTSLDVARQSGQLPEIAAVSDVKGYSATGDILPLTDLPGGAQFIEEYGVELVQGRNKIGDVIYNVPATSNVPGLIYNKDLFKEAGLVDDQGEALPPATWEEVRTYAKKLTDPAKQVYGLSFPMKDSGLFFNYMLRTCFASSFGDMVKYDYDNLSVSFDSYRYAFDWMMRIKGDKSMFPGPESLDNDTARAYFAEGKIGMLLGLSWDVGVLTTQFIADCDWGVAPVPVVEGMERQPTWRDMSGSYSVTKSASNLELEKVMEVYRFIFSLNTQKVRYEKGIRIPCNKAPIKAADTAGIPVQFKEFAELLDEDFIVRMPPSLKLDGDVDSAVMMKVWAGAATVDQAISDLNARYTNALRAGVESGAIDVGLYKH